MQKVFDNPSTLEVLVKEKYGFPDFIMMENAALAMKNLITETLPFDGLRDHKCCLILCGKGNNGGDGYALARLLYGQVEVLLFCLEPPSAAEAKTQYEMCRKIGIRFVSQKQLFDLFKNPPAFIVDCLYGTGFKGQLSPQVLKIIEAANKAKSTRIACDIPTALTFNAHYTVTMGEQKLALFSDKAKEVCGKILVAPLGIDRTFFENIIPPSKIPAFLITADDLKLPMRTNKAAHKGSYGHTAVFAGQKSGAGIICATAAMNFGSGLTSLIRSKKSNLAQFKISPQLMISEPDADNGNSKIPAKTSCVVYGPGIENIDPQDVSCIKQWFSSTNIKNSALVFDAGVFGEENFPTLLRELNARTDARIVLTPHLLELTRLCKNLKIFKEVTVTELADNPETKIKIEKKLNKLFPNTTLVIKSANTFIASGGQIYIITDGAPSLAKGGSGDVLAGMIAALLSQGYSAKEAAITACEAHALIGKNYGEDAYDLSPEKMYEDKKKFYEEHPELKGR